MYKRLNRVIWLNRLTGWFLLIFLVGCSFQPVGKASEIISVVNEPDKEYSIYFCPRDDCEKGLADFILIADLEVYCTFFDLDLPKVKSALERQYKKGLDVKLIVDSDNYEMVEDMGIPIKQDERSPYMHNKFCEIDGKWISTGSFNPTVNGAVKNNNNLIIIKSSGLALNYKKEFEELWNGEFGKGEVSKKKYVYLNGSRFESYFCPEDQCGEKIKQSIKDAQESIYFLTFSFTHESIANSIMLRMIDNVTVKGVFEKRGAGTEYSRYKIIKYQGADLRLDNNSGVMHHKVFIIDKKIVITGSFNPSKNADTRNDENILIIYDENIAKRYLEEFEYVWENYAEK